MNQIALALVIGLGALAILVLIVANIAILLMPRRLLRDDEFPLPSEDDFRPLDQRYREAGE